MAVTFGKIKTLVTVAIAMFGLNHDQAKMLEDYVKIRENAWVEQRKSDWEVETLINSEARSVSGK